MLGGIEAGGTKFICAVTDSPPGLTESTRIATTTPAETLAGVLAFFEQFPDLESLGVGSFGPVDLDRDSPTFGHITHTPKPLWEHTDVLGPLRALGVPLAFDTDVNAALLGEQRHGAAQGLSDVVYVTVGTGIGGGAMANGRLVHGLGHPEMGHQLVPRLAGDAFPGSCPFHGACLEGLASGPAMEKRWGVRAEALPDDHEGWELQARYLAAGLANIASILAPGRIVVGGGLGLRPGLLDRVIAEMAQLMAGYCPIAPKDLVVPAALGGEAGVVGACAHPPGAVEG